MTVKAYLIGAIIAIVASAAVPSLTSPDHCATVIECTQKEPIE